MAKKLLRNTNFIDTNILQVFFGSTKNSLIFFLLRVDVFSRVYSKQFNFLIFATINLLEFYKSSQFLDSLVMFDMHGTLSVPYRLAGICKILMYLYVK
jgi:hypothetical protein